MNTQFYIDAREAFRKNLDGKGSYANSIIRELRQELATHNVTILLEEQQSTPPDLPKSWSIVHIPGQNFSWQVRAALYLRKKKNVVLFSPTSFVLPFLANKPFIVTVHDLIAFKFSNTHSFKAVLLEKLFLPRLLKRQKSKIICVSKTTARDLQELHPKHISPERIKVAYLGVSENFKQPITPSKNDSDELNILTVGTIIPRKNVAFLIKAFDQMLTTEEFKKPVRLNIVGAKGWQGSEVEAALKSATHVDQITLHGFLSNEELIRLYKVSDCCVYPSKYEGFGLPLVEAMYFGKPMAVADTDIFHEIAEDSALYFSPTNIDDAASKMSRLLQDESTKAKLVAAGKKRLQMFNYKDSATAVIDAYKELSQS